MGVEGKDPQESSCYVTDGSCRTCLFPLTQSNVEAVTLADGTGSHTMTCGLCATKWDLNSGEVLDFLPGNGPAQFAAKLANSKKEETPCTVLKTRISLVRGLPMVEGKDPQESSCYAADHDTAQGGHDQRARGHR